MHRAIRSWGLPAASASGALQQQAITRCTTLQVQEVCRLVCQRSARLIALGVAALLRQMGRDGSEGPAPRTAVVVDGGVAAHYAAHRTLLREGLRDLLGGSAAARIALTTVRDASSMGAAYLAAAAASRGAGVAHSPGQHGGLLPKHKFGL